MYEVEDAHQRSEIKKFIPSRIQTDSGTNGHVEDVFYKTVRDKRSVRLENERCRRMEKKNPVVCKPY